MVLLDFLKMPKTILFDLVAAPCEPGLEPALLGLQRVLRQAIHTRQVFNKHGAFFVVEFTMYRYVVAYILLS